MGYIKFTESMFNRPFLLVLALALPGMAATFGTVTLTPGPVADIVLDEARNRLYVLEPSVNPPVVAVYTAKPVGLLSRIQVESSTSAEPIAMAMSPDGRYLYVACYATSALDVIDLNTRTKINTITLAANPEAVAVGFDGKVLVSTIGGSGRSVLVTYDPNASTANSLQGIAVAPAAPTAPTYPPPNGTLYLSAHARLAATPDGKLIVGVHQYAASRTVFVYNPASSTVLAARTVAGVNPVLAVSPDGSRFMSGPLLFDSKTLAVLATQDTRNSPFLFNSGSSLSSNTTFTSTTQPYGGAVFAPDGSQILTAYNIPPFQVPTPRANMAQLLINAPDNLLVQVGLQLTENLSGKMTIASDATVYGISQSGFIAMGLATLRTSPVAMPDTAAALLATDQCGVVAGMNSAVIPVRNAGGGSLTNVTAQLVSTATTSTQVSAAAKSYGADVTARINANVARTPGTANPDQILLQSSVAVNVIPAIRVFQNNRNSEARGAIVPVDYGATNSGLTDLLADSARNRLYMTNPGQNRVEIFDTKAQKFLSPVSVGQLPVSMAFGGDSSTLYVANGQSEFVSIVDLNKGTVVGTATFPALPFSTGTGATNPVYPSVIASSQHGPRVLMSDGTLWKVVGNSLLPMVLNSPVSGTITSIAGPTRQMVSTPDGAYTLILSGNGTAYLYSASDDTIVNERSALANPSAPISSYYGAVAAGPNAAYFLVNDQVLNASLTIQSAPTSSVSTGQPISITVGPITIIGLPAPVVSLTARPVAAVAAANATTYVRFSTPLRTSTAATPADAGLVELVDVATGRAATGAYTLEGPASQVIGSNRVNVNGRAMALDSASGTVYLLTASGLSVVPLAASTGAPSLTSTPMVSTANFQNKIAPGGLVSVFGQNLGSNGTAGGTPLPSILGGSCVTLSNTPLPLLATSPTQINAQLPPTLAAGTYALVVRSVANQAASGSVNVAVSKYAPAVFMDAQGPAIFHKDGTRVDKSHPASRDEPLTIYATGLGVTTGGRVTAGNPAPSSPLAVTAAVQVFFGDPTISDSGVIVDWSGLEPGMIGVYQIKCRIPGTHLKGDALKVTIRIGGVSSPVTGSNVPVVYVN